LSGKSAVRAAPGDQRQQHQLAAAGVFLMQVSSRATGF